jgi:hypothetical protein
MKRISSSLLSLSLALLLCAALLPNVNVAKADDKNSSNPFKVTGYDVSRSPIETGDGVDVTVYL